LTTLPLWELPEDTDLQLSAVEAELNQLDPTGAAVAGVLRDTFDQLYDGQHSGRWAYEQLRKTEKTHMGTLVEVGPTTRIFTNPRHRLTEDYITGRFG